MVPRHGGNRGLQKVHRALHAPAATVEDMSVDHGGLHALVPEELLHRPDVVAVYQQVRGEGVAQSVAGRQLHQPRRTGGVVEGLLEGSVVQMMPPALSRPRIPR